MPSDKGSNIFYLYPNRERQRRRVLLETEFSIPVLICSRFEENDPSVRRNFFISRRMLRVSRGEIFTGLPLFHLRLSSFAAQSGILAWRYIVAREYRPAIPGIRAISETFFPDTWCKARIEQISSIGIRLGMVLINDIQIDIISIVEYGFIPDYIFLLRRYYYRFYGIWCIISF